MFTKLIDLLPDLIAKYTPFKGRRTKLGSLVTVLGAIFLLATGQLDPKLATGAILLAVNDLFASTH